MTSPLRASTQVSTEANRSSSTSRPPCRGIVGAVTSPESGAESTTGAEADDAIDAEKTAPSQLSRPTLVDW
ncbi:hypothetical protein BE17_28880 [Sorangium cellulosum]|uniref:Uncharacterized protein n=1 Tax=Sorangium cellulosum TaxID=56 RepID=A0A150RHC7_SORCE|nr:hypothetical protein BE17_28880 [Sorangium cellulosum]